VTHLDRSRKSAQVCGEAVGFRFVVDATGANGWLRRQLKLPARRITPQLTARVAYQHGAPVFGILPEFEEHVCGWTWRARVRTDCCQMVRLELNQLRTPSGFSSGFERSQGADVTWRFVPEVADGVYFLCGDAAAVLDPAAPSGTQRALESGCQAGERIVEIARGKRAESAAAGYRSWSAGLFAGQARMLLDRYRALTAAPPWLDAASGQVQQISDICLHTLSIKHRMTKQSLCSPGKTMTKKTTKKATKKAVKRAAPKRTPGNINALTKAGVIPKNYQYLSDTDKAALEKLSAAEVKAIISTRTKLGDTFFSKHASHGMVY
jgi:flavin-dependent dehydrogenase